ncbi:MAG: GNAT family protein [Bacteroidota bacterium]
MRPDLFDIDTAILTTRTLTRRMREGDGASFYELVQANHSYIEEHFPILVESVRSPEDGEIFARQKLAQWLVQKEYSFGIWRVDEADMIGFVHFRNIDWQTPRAEISYFLHQEQAGKGIMTEVMSRMIQFAFKQLQLNKLVLKTLIDNYGSQRLARKVGFRREGDLRHEYRKASGVLLDVMLFGLTREEYGE